MNKRLAKKRDEYSQAYRECGPDPQPGESMADVEQQGYKEGFNACYEEMNPDVTYRNGQNDFAKLLLALWENFDSNTVKAHLEQHIKDANPNEFMKVNTINE